MGCWTREKAESKLRWTPTPITEAVKKTTQFYNSVLESHEFDEQKREIKKSLVEDLVDVYPDIDAVTLKRTLTEILNIS